MKNILITGYGKTGSHLYHALKKTGKYGLSVIKDKKEFTRRLKTTGHKNKCAASFIGKADIIFICVKDSQITGAAEMISQSGAALKNKIIFHTSGALTAAELRLLKKHGAVTGSFHPVQSFAKTAGKFSGTFNGIYIALEGDAAAVKAGEGLAKTLGSNSIVLNEQGKIYHHICCVMSSNYLAALNYKVEETGLKRIRKNGFNKTTFLNIYKPLAVQTLENGALHGAAGSLTGPIERFDLATIKAHLDALKKVNKGLLMFYILMGIETIKPALKKKSINNKQSAELYKLFSNYIIKQ